MAQNADVKQELVAIADELDRRGLKGMADEVTQILAAVVREERVASLPDPEYLVQYADQLDQQGRYEEADKVTAYAQRVAMVRTAQEDTEKARREFWQGRPQHDFYSETGKPTGRGIPSGGEFNDWDDFKSIFGGGPALFKEWRTNVWDRMTPVQQEDYRKRTGMGSWGKPLNQELYDHWAVNVAPGLRKDYLGTKITQSTPATLQTTVGPSSGSAPTPAAAPTGQIPQDYERLDTEIESTRQRLLQLQEAKRRQLMQTPGYGGAATYSRMMQPLRQQHR